MKYETAIALRYLRSKRKDKFISFTTWISIVGIGIGVMALILVIAVMTGAQDEFRDRILGANPHILISSIDGEIRDPGPVVEKVRGVEGVASASPFIQLQAMAQGRSRIAGTVVKGFAPQDAVTYKRFVKEGSIDSLKKPGTILVGKELARNLNLLPDDMIALIVPDAGFSPAGAVPETVKVRVGGIFETGMFEIDSLLTVMPLSDIQAIVGTGVGGIEVKLNDVYQAGPVRNRIERLLGPHYVGRTWIEMNKNLFSALWLEKTVMFVILGLVILVASFNIISSLVMTVMEKKKDIAILKAMGAANRSIIRVFVIEGLTIGVFGAFLGTVVGTALLEIQRRWEIIKLPSDVYSISTLPMKISPFDIMVIAALTVLLCLLSTLYPSYKASKIDPVETLRYE
jgi:lipoprotein-releasing system permease protein